MQGNNFFVVFKKSMQKHTFESSNIYLKKNIKKNMLGYWPYATHKNILYSNKKTIYHNN